MPVLENLKLDDMPYDILLNMFEKSDFKSLNQLAQVNKKIYTVANDNFLWKHKLIKDIKTWNLIDSKTYPHNLIKTRQISGKSTEFEQQNDDENIIYKKIYMNACPAIVLKKEILEKLETFQQAQNELHLRSTSDDNSSQSNIVPVTSNNNSNNITLSALSSLVMPRLVLGQIRDFIYRNVFNTPMAMEPDESIPKLVMFGPGLETTTSCLVTNILWKSDFKFIGMIPGRDGYGSGIKLKLFNHKPFNLTILYTNVSKIRNNNSRDLNLNRLIVSKEDQFELSPQVREACSNCSGFIYVVDNKHLASLDQSSIKSQIPEPGNIHNLSPVDNYKLELNVLMKEVDPELPLLILGCYVNELEKKDNDFSCVDIIEKLELFNLKQDWQIRNCDVFQPRLKDIMLGFEWMLGKLDQKYLLKQYKSNNGAISII